MANPEKSIRGTQLVALRQLQLPDCNHVSAGALKAVLRCIDDHCGSEGACWASVPTIAIETNFNARTVHRALPKLVELGYVSAEKRHGQATIYRLLWDAITHDTMSGVNPCHHVTPDTVSPLTPCHSTPDTMSGDPCHHVMGPLTPCHPKREETRRTESETKHTVRAHRFSAPSVDEVREFWKAGSLNGSPDEFHDHYTANGWTQGKRSTAMKDWHAAARNWSRRQEQFNRPAYGGKPRTANVGAGVVYQGDQSGDPNFGKF